MTYDKLIRAIKERGFMTESQLRVRLGDVDVKAAVKLMLEDPAIHEIKYTNSFVAQYTVKRMYVFNPQRKKRKKGSKKS